jgi:Ca2+-binding RTX toxin-like protein
MLVKLWMIGLACLMAVLPQTAWAAVTSSVNGGVLTVSSDAGDAITITCQTGDVKVNGDDPDSGSADCSTITGIIVNGGPGDNAVDLSGVSATDFTTLISTTVSGGDGVDMLTGSNLVDTLDGGSGGDTLVGVKGNDIMRGGPGADILVWNNGDNSDIMDGDGDEDTVEVNGAPVGDAFEIGPAGSRVAFTRTNLISFTLNISSENLIVNGLDGDDVMTGTLGLSNLISMTLNGGNGADTLTGGDGIDRLNGDADNDVLIGFKGNDLMSGGPGTDRLIWNNGDNSDTMDGDGDEDTVEVNGAPVGDEFEIGVAGARAIFTRTNLISFTLSISSENLLVNGLGGGDIMTGSVGLNGVISMTLNGDDGNDRLTGGDGIDRLNGGPDDDTLIGVKGNDLMRGEIGNDTLVWNNGDNSDTMDGDEGEDTVQVNGAPVGDAFEIGPAGERVTFTRTNLISFTLSISSENLVVNGLDGDDIMTGTLGLSGLISMTLNGGNGNDQISGGDGIDRLNGDADNDILIGFKGNDLMNGGPGDDLLVWNNGDNSDVMNGDEDADTVEVNGAPVGDAFEVAPAGGRVAFTRTNLISFTLDISAEVLAINSGEGEDTISAIPLASTRIAVDGGEPDTGDSLTVDAQDQRVILTPGTVLVQGHQPITHVDVEQVTLRNAALALYLPLAIKSTY